MKAASSLRARASALALGFSLVQCGPVLADGLSDAQAGMAAMQRGDNAGAIRLFTQAITSGQLSKADLELAYLKRAEADLAVGDVNRAQVDARVATAMDPNDPEAAAALREAQAAALPAPPPPPAQELWGATAVAVEPNHFPLPRISYGAAWGRADKNQAINDAIAACKEAGGRTYCRWATTWTHGCGYIAGGTSLLFTGWGAGATPEEASLQCSKHAKGECRPPVGGCNP